MPATVWRSFQIIKCQMLIERHFTETNKQKKNHWESAQQYWFVGVQKWVNRQYLHATMHITWKRWLTPFITESGNLNLGYLVLLMRSKRHACVTYTALLYSSLELTVVISYSLEVRCALSLERSLGTGRLGNMLKRASFAVEHASADISFSQFLSTSFCSKIAYCTTASFGSIHELVSFISHSSLMWYPTFIAFDGWWHSLSLVPLTIFVAATISWKLDGFTAWVQFFIDLHLSLCIKQKT